MGSVFVSFFGARRRKKTTTSIMSSEESQKKVVMFDTEAASLLVKDLRGSFGSGKTRSYEWRVLQVKALLKMVDENEEQIVDALRSDLDKPPFETVVYEVTVDRLHVLLALGEGKGGTIGLINLASSNN